MNPSIDKQAQSRRQTMTQLILVQLVLQLLFGIPSIAPVQAASQQIPEIASHRSSPRLVNTPNRLTSGTFTTHEVTTALDRPWSVYAADVDGDGDLDILSATLLDDTIAWYENSSGKRDIQVKKSQPRDVRYRIERHQGQSESGEYYGGVHGEHLT